MSDIVWDLALIQKYNQSGPRYTSYPTALEFNENYTNQDFIQATKRYPNRPLNFHFISISHFAISCAISVPVIKPLLVTNTKRIFISTF